MSLLHTFLRNRDQDRTRYKEPARFYTFRTTIAFFSIYPTKMNETMTRMWGIDARRRARLRARQEVTQ